VKILITGAAGFVGSECMHCLRRAGHELITTDKIGSTDLSGDLTDVTFVKSLPDVSAVLHCAGVQYFSAGLPLLARRDCFYRNNTLATKNLTARYAGTDTHFVYVSTSMIYDQNNNGSFSISSPKKANGIYTASKIAAQTLVEQMGNPFTVIVPCIIAGSGRGGLFASLIRSMKRFGIAAVPGKGTNAIHLVHVEDVASLISLVLEKHATGYFHAADPEPMSIQNWIDEIQAELQLPRVRRLSVPLRAVEVFSVLFGYIPLAREQLLLLRYPHVLQIEESCRLGWKPHWNNAQTIRETARALIQNGL
jgi:nucleoside-diphosphate-sugar epimerase